MDIKKQLARLWKDTFHDSDAYVSLVFDNYFDPDLCEYETVGEEIVAGLIGIPYNFGNAERSLRGLYLCGLATDPRYRSRGIMTRLLVRINSRAREAGYAFTFLIPADKGLRKYYQDREYVNGFYRVVDNYTSLHDFDRDYEAYLAEQKEKVADLKRHYYESLNTGLLVPSNMAYAERKEGIRELIMKCERDQEDLQILHSEADIDLLIEENALSNGEIHYVATPAGKVTAVAFVVFDNTSVGRVNIVKLYEADIASRYKVLGSIKKRHPESGMQHYRPSIEMDRKALWMRTYGTVMPQANQVPEISMTERVYSLAAHARVYGMVRILDLVEILKFQAEGRRDLKYSILAKKPDGEGLVQIDARDGKVKVRECAVSEMPNSKTAHVMSLRDIGEILFRRRDSDNLITEAFGIPSINAAASLLLD